MAIIIADGFAGEMMSPDQWLRGKSWEMIPTESIAKGNADEAGGDD